MCGSEEHACAAWRGGLDLKEGGSSSGAGRIKGEQNLEKMPVGMLVLRVLRVPVTAGDSGATKRIVNPGQIP